MKGCKDVYESFDKYVQIEQMIGDNKYFAEGHGLQDALKGTSFLTFPKVIFLHLKRFEMRFNDEQMELAKVNDEYRFDPIIKLEKYLDSSVDKTKEDATFHLHGVLVHSGNVHGGHYVVFIKPSLKPFWYKFDDEKVSLVEEREAIENNFGGQTDVTSSLLGTKSFVTKSTNACKKNFFF